ncbi:hypothetical protein [Streptomyces sp. NPDC006355]|uniref:hypothetical protein n=1 Tax=Streptomyces sp. NPDC006355 TaxID=3156758 RepID=UPI0033ABF1E5
MIISGGNATPRVDVEAVVLCDVQADGTVAATVLLEPVYDTSSGARVGTRIVDPVTGADYTPTGTLTTCGGQDAAAGADVETWPLCVINTNGSVLQHVRAVQVYDEQGAPSGPPGLVDAVTGGPVAIPGGATIGVCPDGAPCDSPTTPTTTVGLCLPDGRPIAVTVVRDCDGAVTQEGWIDLTTGTFSAGAPPAGTVACGDSRSIAVSGTFCDVDPATGDVLGLVLIEYAYAADGTISSVRLVDAVTGATYTPAGTVTTCPAGVEQPEQDVVQLCDVQTDGTSTPFIRDYRRDETGAVAGHTDYTLDGAAYTPTGTVGRCEQTTCETLTLCDSSPVPIPLTAAALPDSAALHFRDVQCTTCAPAINPAGPSLQPLFDGGATVFPPPSTSPNDGWHWWSAGALATDACVCPDATVTLSLSVDFTNDGPQAQQGGGTGLFLFNGDTRVDSRATGAAAGVTDTLTVTGSVPFEDLAAGRIAVFVMVEGAQNGGFKQWTLSDLQMTAAVDCGQPFLRTLCRDVTGAVVSTTDTLDGSTAYTPVAPVKLCGQPDMRCEGPEEPAPDVEVVQLCDVGTTVLTYEDTTTNAPTTAYKTAYPETGVTYDGLDVNGANLWSGTGTAVFPDKGAFAVQGWQVTAGRITIANPPACGTPAQVQLQATVRVTRGGPNGTVGVSGRFAFYNGSAPLGVSAGVSATPVGTSRTLTATATVPYADLLAGNIGLGLALETTENFQHGSWTADQFALTVTSDGPVDGCGEVVQFLRHFVIDPVTRTVLDHFDTDLDGTPYAPVNVAACPTGTSSTPDTCTKQVVERCGCDDTTGDGAGDTTFTELWAVDPCGAEAPVLLGTYLDGDLTQPYTPVAPVECTTADALPAPLRTGVRAVTGTAVQDLTAGFPGLQSVSLTVMAGVVNVTMSDGAAVPVPAGVTMTWSVAKDEDVSLAAASFTGASASASYLLNWTYQ